MISYGSLKINKILKKELVKDLLHVINLDTISDLNVYREKLAEEFSARLHCNYTVFTDSGTTALIAALLQAGVQPGDEVITSPVTWVATGLAIQMIGATPVFVDIDEYLTIDPEQIKKHITPKTKAIVPVHIFGHTAQIDVICQLAKEHNLAVVEDSCQVVLNKYKNKFLGTYGDFGCFSFDPHKSFANLGAGGAVVFDKDCYHDLRLMLMPGKYHKRLLLANRSPAKISYTDLAFLHTKIRYASFIRDQKKQCQRLYDELLTGVKTFPQKPDEDAIRQVYVIEHERNAELFSHLKKHKIIAQMPYDVLHTMDIFNHSGSLPYADQHYKKALYLPLATGMTTDEVRKVCAVVNDFTSRSQSS